MKIDSLCLCLCFSLSGVLAEMSDKGRHLGEWHTPLGFHGEQLAWIRLPIEAGQRDFFSSSLSTLAQTRQYLCVLRAHSAGSLHTSFSVGESPNSR